MADFEYAGAEFLDVIRKYELSTMEDLVDFFLVYYEFTVSSEFDDSFPSFETQQEFLLKSLNEICNQLNIDYNARYKDLSDFELKQIWWYLETALTVEVFKETKPVFVQNATMNFKRSLPTLTESTLEVQKMFLNVLLEEIPFAPRPIFNNWYQSAEFDATKVWFLQFCKDNEQMISIKKLKEGLLLPYELCKKFLNTDELMFDVYIVSLFEILKVIDENNKEQLLNVYVSEFFKNTCIQKAVREKHKQELFDKTLILTDFLLKDIEKEDFE